MHGDHNRQALEAALTGTVNPTVVAYAAGEVYARCECGWEGTHRPVARDGSGNEQALRAADREVSEHSLAGHAR
ncbi:MAG: hypothetical protein ACRD0K_27060 [Egibacteraceae bacterium]